MTPTVYLLHGRDSSPLSLKIKQLSAIATLRGWKVVAPDFSATTDPDLRVSRFLEIAEGNPEKCVIVGSSMGGYVALLASRRLKPEALLLLAPALNLEGYGETDPKPVAGETTIIHGWNDSLIEPLSVFQFANEHRTTLHMVNDEHALQQSIPFIETVFISLLKRCESTPRRLRLTTVI